MPARFPGVLPILRGVALRALVNLVVLGDSNAEIDAAKTATDGFWEQASIKTVRFKNAPTVSDLLGEVRHAGIGSPCFLTFFLICIELPHFRSDNCFNVGS